MKKYSIVGSFIRRMKKVHGSNRGLLGLKIQLKRRERVKSMLDPLETFWIPAYAGMTKGNKSILFLMAFF
jgi:hypothetical protein